MQAALKAAEDLSSLYSIPRSKIYTSLLSCESPANISITVEGPYETDTLDEGGNASSFSSQYLQDMQRVDHLRVVANSVPSVEDDEIILSSASSIPMIPPSQPTNLSLSPWTFSGSSIATSLYHLPFAVDAQD